MDPPGTQVLLLALFLGAACLLPAPVHGQGLVVGKKVVMGGAGSAARLSGIYRQSRSWKDAFSVNPRAACRATGQSPCSAAAVGRNASLFALLTVAASPPVYSSASPASTGGLSYVPAARDQRPCAACTAFAVAAAAQAAVAAALRRNASAIEPLSVLDLMYCGTGAPTACGAGWTLPGVLGQLTQRRVSPESCLPYRPPPLDGGGRRQGPPAECAAPGCAPRDDAAARDARSGAAGAHAAARHHEIASLGTFSYQSVFQDWAVAAHIRNHGAVVSRFDILDDFSDFFSHPANRRRVYRPKTGAKLVETHAVAIVGYDMTEGSWLCLNSWSDSFADGGLFKVAFGECSVALAPDTYGVVWKPTLVAGRKLIDVRTQALVPSPARPDCSSYVALAGDSLAGLSQRFGAPLNQLLLDNLGIVSNLDAPIAGKMLSICGTGTPLSRTISAFKQALANKTAGISLNCYSYPNYYTLGVLDTLRELGVYTADTKTASMGRGNGCALCAGWGIPKSLEAYDKLRHKCANDYTLCMDGHVKDAMQETTESTLSLRGVAAKCRDKCYMGVSEIDPTVPNDRGSYYEVGNYIDDADFLQAWLATGYYPAASDGEDSMEFRRKPSVSGVSALASRQPPCPPGVEFCLRVTCAPPPDFFPPEMSFEVVGRVIAKVSREGVPAYSTLSHVLVVEGAEGKSRDAAARAAAAAALEYEPSAYELQGMGAQAAEWNVDIAPNLYNPLNLSLDGARDMAALPPDDELAVWLTALGRKDARLWARLWGVSGGSGESGSSGGSGGGGGGDAGGGDRDSGGGGVATG